MGNMAINEQGLRHLVTENTRLCDDLDRTWTPWGRARIQNEIHQNNLAMLEWAKKISARREAGIFYFFDQLLSAP